MDSFPRELPQRHLCTWVPSTSSPFRRREERKKKVMLVDPEYANHATLLYVKPHPLSQFFLFSCLTASAQRPTMTDVVAQLQECLQLEEARATAAGDVDGSGSTSDPYSGYNAYAAAAGVRSSAGFEYKVRIQPTTHR